MPSLLSLLIVASVAAAPTGGEFGVRVATAVATAAASRRAIPTRSRCFTAISARKWDTNFDHWPDRWIRQQSAAYPHYLPIRITDEPTPVKGRSLRVDLGRRSRRGLRPAVQSEHDLQLHRRSVYQDRRPGARRSLCRDHVLQRQEKAAGNVHLRAAAADATVGPRCASVRSSRSARPSIMP